MTTRLTVTSTEWVTPSLRRIWFHSDDLSAFEDSHFTDRYVKLVFPKPGVEYPEPLDVRALRKVMPAEDLPVVRTYTAMFPDVAAGTMAIDFVVHGDEGVAGPWAKAAVPGDLLLVNGPGGGYVPDPEAAWHLLVGDESAIPAITAALSALPEDAVAQVVIQVESPAHVPQLCLPAAGELTVVLRSTPQCDTGLLDAVRSLAWLPGRVQVFAHGEAEAVMRGLRPHLLEGRGVSRDQASISGYWRRGRTEEGFRSWKADVAATTEVRA